MARSDYFMFLLLVILITRSATILDDVIIAYYNLSNTTSILIGLANEVVLLIATSVHFYSRLKQG